MYKFNWTRLAYFTLATATQTVWIFYANNFTLKALDEKPHRLKYGPVVFWGPLWSWGVNAA
jgi:hypothetical protein